ncbi:hypothetical protein [uncultured Litoreibacter sp.]|uniref:hypothetical protein n=1 Tax=uncultured Litoreibacter sp. TaxID=1392394 RepID=UPI002612CADF|nr:hypothetical protein [uncultured Litoreibacter sp.]
MSEDGERKKHVGKALATVSRRRALGGELAFVCSAGFLVGVLIAGSKDESLLFLTAPLVVPMLFGFAYFLFFRWEKNREAELNWERETELDKIRQEKTQERIAQAKARGEFDKWNKKP